MFIKIHRSYRVVVALCDEELIGKKFEEGKKQLYLRENFYQEEKVDKEQAVRMLLRYAREDATFNIAGKESVSAAIESGIINEKQVATIAKIPFTLIF